MRTSLLAAAVLLAAGAAASAQSFSTGFTGTTTLANTGQFNGNFFDITALNPGGITINSWDIHVSTTGARTVQVWYKPGTWVGAATNAGAWTLAGEVQVNSAGAGNPTPVPVGNITIPPGETYGFRIGVNPAALRYNGAGAFQPTIYNDDVRLDRGSVQADIFVSNPVNDRAWNGTIYYTAHGVTPTGRCCLISGLCETKTEFACTFEGGTYGGDNTSCAGFSCPQPPTGACCLSTGCAIDSIYGCQAGGGVYNGDGTTCSVALCARYHFEVEPNDTRFAANHIVVQDGDGIVGISTAAAGTGNPDSPDYFRIQTAAAPLAIYRHRLALSNAATPSNSTWIRGQTQTAAPPGPWPGPVGTASGTESTGQSHQLVGSDRVNYWYGFGKEEQIYYRVAGLATSTGVYVADYERTTIVPTSLGSFEAGPIIIDTSGQGHTTDTHVRIYDSNFEPILGYANDGASIDGGAPANLTTSSYLLRDYLPGTYYMAIAVGNLATDQGSPCDDNVRTGIMMDFPNVAVDTGALTATNVSFAITDVTGTTPVSAFREGRNQIAWFTFSVSGTAPCYANCDGSTTAPILNVEDFTCFINEFAAATQLPHEQQLTHYANCDQSTTAPVLNVEDFTCFINQFAQGCP
jgi:hypothetical protein